MADFSDFELDARILDALEKLGFEKPSPIQEKTLPLILSGRDVIGLAETGSGKTAACAIPVCQLVDPEARDVQALILVPTRELALQYAMETQKIGGRKGVSAFAMYGGEDMSMQRSKLKAGVQVLIATPGRLIDFVYNREIDLSHVATLILDEADEMLSMGFIEDIEFLIQCLVQKHQTLLFSATMSPEIKNLAKRHLHEPEEVALTTKRAAPAKIQHQFVFCKHISEKAPRLIQLLRDEKPNQSLIFCGSRRQTEEVFRTLRRGVDGVDFLHGGLAQGVRTSLTDKFRRQRIRHMVATDVAARGLDFSGVSHVFIFHLSQEIEAYVHRTGRTGRSGREGKAITLLTSRDMKLLDRVLHKIGREAEWIGPPPSRPQTPEQSKPRPRRRSSKSR